MDLLVVNVNTTASMTARIAEVARSAASPGTRISGLTPRFGAESVEGNFESYLAAVAVMDAVTAYAEPYDAVILAGFGEHGIEGLRELLSVPAIDITEAAAMLALPLGRSYSVVTTLDRTVPLIEDRLRLSGLADRCASVRASGRPVPELEDESALEAIVAVAREAVELDRAEVICLGCGGMAGVAEAVSSALGVPVIDPIAAAVRVAESLHALGLRTSKVRTFADPRPKTISGWPL